MSDIATSPSSERRSELQEIINRTVYQRSGVERAYWQETLTPVETAALLRYQPFFFDRDVLDVGVGTGRTTRYLAPLARRYLGIDYSEPMLQKARARNPGAAFRLLDMLELAVLGSDEFDFVFAPNNVIDAASETGRDQVLSGFHAVLRAGGILMFSSHNLRYGSAFGGPHFEPSPNPIRFARNLQQYARQMVNHRRVGRFRRVESDHAILNDSGHDYSLLHYYIDRSGCEQQLRHAGFRLLTILDSSGAVLADEGMGEGSSSLMYVAQRD